MKRNRFRIILSKHAFKRAMQRRITPDLIFKTLKSGKLKEFGKNRVKIEKKFRNFTVVCVDEIQKNSLKIVTIERR